MRSFGQVGAVGIEMFGAIVAGYLSGWYLDQYLGITPWLTVFLTLCGVGAAVKALVRVARHYKEQLKQ